MADRQLRCPLPGCESPLFIKHTLTYSVWAEDTAAWIGDPINANTRTWQVGCEEGHVILLPVDRALDDETFGGEPEDKDMDRLLDVAIVPTSSDGA
jgi:hypothetical protein